MIRHVVSHQCIAQRTHVAIDITPRPTRDANRISAASCSLIGIRIIIFLFLLILMSVCVCFFAEFALHASRRAGQSVSSAACEGLLFQPFFCSHAACAEARSLRRDSTTRVRVPEKRGGRLGSEGRHTETGQLALLRGKDDRNVRALDRV